MFRFSGFTQRANSAINVAVQQAGLLGHTYIGTEHLVLGLLDENSGVAYAAFSRKNARFAAYRAALVSVVGQGDKTILTPEDFTPRCKKTLEAALLKARLMGQSQVGTEHILMALAKEADSAGIKLLRQQGIDPDSLVSSLAMEIGTDLSDTSRRHNPRLSGSATGTAPTATTTQLNRFSRDLTALAAAGSLDPVIGREAEIARMLQILVRRTKNNPCLIGEAGVGKTALAEGLALRIVQGQVPPELLNKRIAALDLTAMVAGAKYRGDFEDRIKKVMEELAGNRDIILFIDELHTLMGAGAAEGAIDAANILKPPLARGQIQVIGATTIGEYRRFIEKDAALERRFQSILIEPPSEEASIHILSGLRSRYEAHHNITISDEAIAAAVGLSVRFLPERFLPDKAIDLLDEAASRLRLSVFSAPPPLVAETVPPSAQNTALLPPPAPCLTADDIAQLITHMTGITALPTAPQADSSLLGLEQSLNAKIFGQRQAVAAVSDAIHRNRAGLADPGRPMGSFLFSGPTGVGKTALCKALAHCLFGSGDSLIRLDMSEYMEKHMAARLVGAPPGYVGFEDGGQLTEQVRRHPYSVVLFDEIEKAHSDVSHLLLQILEDGTLTDSQGRKVNFRNTVVILTSNIGARHAAGPGTLGFTPPDSAPHSHLQQHITADLRRHFRPELLNRLDDIIIFHPLSSADLTAIVQSLLAELAHRAGTNHIALTFSPALIAQLATAGDSHSLHQAVLPDGGARPLRRALRRYVEKPLAEGILRGDFPAGSHIFCDYRGDFIFEKQG